MENVGKWNSDIVWMVSLSFFAPVFIAAVVKSLAIIFYTFKRPSGQHYLQPSESSNTLDDYMVVHKDDLEPEAMDANFPRDQQWELIVEAAMANAMLGDKSARDWVTKHVFSSDSTVVTPQSAQKNTSREIITDAYDSLKTLGYKPKELRAKLKQLCANKMYTDVDDLIQDVIRGA